MSRRPAGSATSLPGSENGAGSGERNANAPALSESPSRLAWNQNRIRDASKSERASGPSTGASQRRGAPGGPKRSSPARPLSTTSQSAGASKPSRGSTQLARSLSCCRRRPSFSNARGPYTYVRQLVGAASMCWSSLLDPSWRPTTTIAVVARSSTDAMSSATSDEAGRHGRSTAIPPFFSQRACATSRRSTLRDRGMVSPVRWR